MIYNSYRQMNLTHYRTLKEVPHTPNLEEQKQKYKSKSKRKHIIIQPTNPPTPKLVKQTNSKGLLERSSQLNQQGCVNHPERKGCYYFEMNTSKRYCYKCKTILGGDAQSPDKEKMEKMNGLMVFKNRIKECNGKISDLERVLHQESRHEEDRIIAALAHISTSFQTLRTLLEEKEAQLSVSLARALENMQKYRTEALEETNQVKKAFNRYIADIDRNYEDIINELSFTHYEEIMEKYNAKVIHYNGTLNKISTASPSQHVLYLPLTDLERLVGRIKLTTSDGIFRDETKGRRDYTSVHIRRGSKQNNFTACNENSQGDLLRK